MIRPEKQILRDSLKKTLAAFSEKGPASAKIRGHLLASGAWKSARVVYGFAPLAAEPDWLDDNAGEKILALPRVENGGLHFFVGGTLQKGALGVREPAGGKPAPAPDLVLVPGLAFDAAGFRLGRGGGFYDRWLTDHRGVQTLGLCFACQLVEKIPVEMHDVRVDAVLTEEGLRRLHRSRPTD